MQHCRFIISSDRTSMNALNCIHVPYSCEFGKGKGFELSLSLLLVVPARVYAGLRLRGNVRGWWN